MNRSYTWLFAITTFLATPSAFAQITIAPAPDATFLMGGAEMFGNGQSNNLGPLMSQVLDNHWIEGECTEVDDFAKCDSLRFGLTVFPPASCTQDISRQVVAREDGGKFVEQRVGELHSEGGTTWCDEEDFRPHDDAMNLHHASVFPSGTSASESELDQYWTRPRLTLFFVGELPQQNNSDEGDKVIETLRAACRNFRPTGGLPSMPTWTSVERRFDVDAPLYAGLVAAAGGTGQCCYGAGCSPASNPIDVCTHIEDGRTDAQIRDDITDREYACGGNGTSYGPGAMGFEAEKGTLPAMRCHFVGEDGNNKCNCSGCEPTDILGILSCVRQLERGVSANDANFLYCPTPDLTSCVPLDEVGGSIEWIDEDKTLYLVKGVACDQNIAVTTCTPNVPCILENELGRCRIGRTNCDTGFEVCERIYDPMPEICNGLDDSCDGKVDNIVETWNADQFANYSIPAEHAGKECNVADVCRCPSGASDLHTGTTFDEYLEGWGGSCACGEGLTPADEPAPSSDSAPLVEDGAACSAVTQPGRALEVGFLSLLLLGFGMFVRRRVQR